MPLISWDEAIIPIFFVYGLAFYSMGLALIVESGRASELGFARSMRLLAGFGLLHGVHEWLEMFERGLELYYQTTFPAWVLWVRLAIFIASLLALVGFGEHLLTRGRYNRDPNWRLTIGAATWYTLSCIIVKLTYNLSDLGWMDANEVLARYILGIPGGVLACLALWHQRRIFREQGMGLFVRDLTIAALALALYGVVGQSFSRPSEIFPSQYVNTALFLRVTGFPIQLFRAIVAVVVAISMIRVLRALEVENQQRLDAAEHAKLNAEQLSREELARLNVELQAANQEAERLLQEVRKRDSLRGELLQRITAAQESERQRIARELHDGTGQALTGLALGLHGLAAQLDNNAEQVARRLPVLETMATNALGELRHLINDLRPPQLDDMGLAAALRWMVERFKDQDKPQVRLEVQGESSPLPSEVETTLFRIAQEGLTNATKHAHADHVWVKLHFGNGVTLTVQDDGIGFDAKTALDGNGIRTGWGLAGMQERANLINAVLTLDSRPQAGTTLTIHLEPQVLGVNHDDTGSHY
jgi:two-component system sensor histidine kinase UhpB